MPPSNVLIELLGGLRISAEGKVREFSAQQAGALLAYIALNPGRSHAREELVDLFWPDDDLDESRAKLRKVLHTVKSWLIELNVEPVSVLQASRTAIQLGSGAATDVAEFEQSLEAASESTDASDRARLLSHGIARYRGSLLPGYYQDCFVSEQSRLAGRYASALRDMTAAYEQIGDLDRALESARRSISHNPLSEEAHCDLMRIYSAKGQPSAVLRQYQDLERILASELGEPPSDSTRKLMESLRETSYGTLASRKTPVDSRESRSRDPEQSRAAKHRIPVRRVLLALAEVAVISVIVWPRLSGEPRLDKAKVSNPSVEATTPLARTVWATEYVPNAGDKDAEPSCIATDESRNIYVAGFLKTAQQDVNYITIKYDPNGAKVWAEQYDGPSHDVDRCRSIAVSKDGTSYVTGDSDNGAGNGATRLCGLDFATIKRDPDGKPSESWPDVGFGVGVRRYNGAKDGENWAIEVALDRKGDAYIAGHSWYAAGNAKRPLFQYVIVKYDSHGNTSWVRPYSEPGLDMRAKDFGVDAKGNCYIAGTAHRFDSPLPAAEYVIVKYEADGKLLWTARYAEQARLCELQKMDIDQEGGVMLQAKSRAPIPRKSGHPNA